LIPEASYKAQRVGDFSADGEGNARINVPVGGRTVVLIEPKRDCLKVMWIKIQGIKMLEISQRHINKYS